MLAGEGGGKGGFGLGGGWSGRREYGMIISELGRNERGEGEREI